MKRSYEDTDVDKLIDSTHLEKDLRAGLSKLTPDKLAALIAEFANSELVDHLATVARRPRIDLPSFSTVKWTDFAEQYGLPSSPSNLNLVPFPTPKYRLPPSLHVTMFENAWRWQDVYREKVGSKSETFGAALFQGRVTDEPETAMVKTQYSNAGHVEHEILMIGGTLFFVVEFKLGFPSDNNLAQLSSSFCNKKLHFVGLRIYGLLTDLTKFDFYSYDPSTKKFCTDERILVNITRTIAFSDMINVSNKIFSTILTAYINGLQAMITRSKDRAKNNDFSLESSAPAQSLERSTSPSSQKPSEYTGKDRKTTSRKSTDQWEAALGLAQHCIDKFNEPVMSFEDIEERANGALGLLIRSVRSIPRASFFTGNKDDPSTPAELKALAVDVIKKEHERYLSDFSQVID